jgi:hypothetical protein
MDELLAFEQAVIAQAPPGAVLIGASISPDGTYGAALTFQPGANYLMDDVLVRRAGHWGTYVGGSGGANRGASSDRKTLASCATEVRPPRVRR